jgi:hypothetical protein
VTAESGRRLLSKLVAALRTGDRKDVMALLAEDVEYAAGIPAASAVLSRNGGRRIATQRPSQADVGRQALYASAAGPEEDWTVDGDRTCRVGYVCPGRAEFNSDQGSVYEMDNETYEVTKVA